jgi:1-acyl-sn-glycerol-3-phosphate acyltransferase
LIGVGLRWTRVLAHFLRGWLTCVALFPFVGQAARNAHIVAWSKQLLKLLRVELQYEGALPEGACVIAANHISWLDIFLVLACRPASFVSKSEAGAWPMIGKLLRAAGTVLIDRGRRKAVHEALQQIRHRLNNQHAVAFFPEGTTSDGTGLLPFHANLFEAAMQPKSADAPHWRPVPVVPIAIRYELHGAICLDAAYIGETTLLDSMHRLIKSGPMQAIVIVGQYLSPADFATRHALAAATQEIISKALRTRSGPE